MNSINIFQYNGNSFIGLNAPNSSDDNNLPLGVPEDRYEVWQNRMSKTHWKIRRVGSTEPTPPNSELVAVYDFPEAIKFITRMVIWQTDIEELSLAGYVGETREEMIANANAQ